MKFTIMALMALQLVLFGLSVQLLVDSHLISGLICVILNPLFYCMNLHALHRR